MIFAFLRTLFFSELSNLWPVVSLVDVHIHLFKEEAVCWDTVTSFEQYDVAHHEVSGIDLG